MKTLIDTAGLEAEHLAIFQENSISDSNIHRLDLDGVKKLLGYGDRGHLQTCSFFNALSLWRRDNMTTLKKMKPLDGFLKYKEVKHLVNIEAILQGDIAGKKIIEFHKINQKLTAAHRSKLIHVIINFILQSKIEVEKPQFEGLTSEILTFFSMDASEAVSKNTFY